jgi:hypothetical protein
LPNWYHSAFTKAHTCPTLLGSLLAYAALHLAHFDQQGRQAIVEPELLAEANTRYEAVLPSMTIPAALSSLTQGSDVECQITAVLMACQYEACRLSHVYNT